MKKLIKNIVRSIGYDIVPFDTEEEQLNQNRYHWLQAAGIKTVIDIGGGLGQYASKIRKVLPKARIITFEVQPSAIEAIKKRMANDHAFDLHHIALSNFNGTTKFNVSSNSGSSSLLPMAQLHKDAYPVSEQITEITVECKRLDDMMKPGEVEKKILLKLDVQGAEKIVLEGAQRMLSETDFIFCEINFVELYQGCVLADDLIEFLNRQGFRLIGIENVSLHPANGTFLQADAWFKPSR